MRFVLVCGLSLCAAPAALGCNDDAKGETAADGGDAVDQTTWYEHVAPLVAEKCTGCHAEGGIAPFSMTDYESAKPFAALMASAVEDGLMPPFLAQETDECAPRLPWANDLRLSDGQMKLLRSWADQGAPKGDAKNAAELPKPPSVVLEREDLKLKLPKAIMVDGKRDLHKCVVIDPKLTEDTYVVGRQIVSGNTSVLHHVVSYLIVPKTLEDGSKQTKAELIADLEKLKGVGPGESYDCFGGPSLSGLTTQMLDAWAPGGVPNMAPEGSGQPVGKDSLVLLDVHYHPTGHGAEADDSTYLGLMLADTKPSMVSRVILIGNFEGKNESNFGISELLKQSGETAAEFLIPANASKHVEEMTWEWKLGANELRVYGMGTHMHYVGRDMLVSLTRAAPTGDEPDTECLIQTPAWDFNWQRGYAYDADYAALPVMREGDRLNIRCVFDNTLDNPHVMQALDHQGLDAPVDVPLGEDTLNEMCLAAIGIIYPNPN